MHVDARLVLASLKQIERQLREVIADRRRRCGRRWRRACDPRPYGSRRRKWRRTVGTLPEEIG
jgi:hypothetical protein